MSTRDEARRKAVVRAATAAAVAAGVALYTWRFTRSISRPQLFCQPGALSKMVLERCNMLTQPYIPAPFAFNAHAQTMLGVLRRLTHWGPYSREICAMRDGGCIALDWFNSSNLPTHCVPHSPILLVLHGITGGSNEGYVKWICASVEDRGWRAVVLNYRGCGGLSLTTPQCYNAMFTDDIHEAVEIITRRFPDAPIYAVGYSLGALLLTKYTAEADSGSYRPGSHAAGGSVHTPRTPTPCSTPHTTPAHLHSTPHATSGMHYHHDGAAQVPAGSARLGSAKHPPGPQTPGTAATRPYAAAALPRTSATATSGMPDQSGHSADPGTNSVAGAYKLAPSPVAAHAPSSGACGGSEGPLQDRSPRRGDADRDAHTGARACQEAASHREASLRQGVSPDQGASPHAIELSTQHQPRHSNGKDSGSSSGRSLTALSQNAGSSEAAASEGTPRSSRHAPTLPSVFTPNGGTPGASPTPFAVTPHGDHTQPGFNMCLGEGSTAGDSSFHRDGGRWAGASGGDTRASSGVTRDGSGQAGAAAGAGRRRKLPGSGLSGAAMISNPFCMSQAAVNLDKPWTMPWLYNLVITHRLKAYMREHQHQVELTPGISLDAVAGTRVLRDFDAAATCVHAGYPSPDIYYKEGSSQNFIPKIRTPSLFLVSQDDPFLGRLPVSECRGNPHTVLAVTRSGGHCAHLQGVWPFGRSWADAALVQYFEALRVQQATE